MRFKIAILSLSILLVHLVIQSSAILIQNRIQSFGTVNEKLPRLSRLHIEGRYIKDEFGNKVFLRGVWIPVRARQTHLEEKQWVYMKDWGMNVVQVAFEPQYESLNWKEQIDQTILWGEKYGMYTIVHYNVWPPGIPTVGWDAWVDLWKELATRYKGRRSVLLGILAEPYKITKEEWQYQAQRCYNAIRAIDSEVIVVIGGLAPPWTSLEWLQTNPIKGSNIVYAPDVFRSKDTPWGSDTINDIKTRLINLKWKWAIDNNIAFLANSFGPEAEDGSPWLENFLKVMGEWELGYAEWCWYTSRMCVLLDWNGTPNWAGKILIDALAGV